jgi:hypothetical protein
VSVALRYAARSDVGLVRSNNQDSAYAGPHLLMVADGMGGHAGGDVASSVAVAAFAPLDGESHGSDDALDQLEAALADATRRLADGLQAPGDVPLGPRALLPQVQAIRQRLPDSFTERGALRHGRIPRATRRVGAPLHAVRDHLVDDVGDQRDNQ